VVVWLFRRWINTENGRAIWDAIKLKVPIFGQLVHKTALTRFSRTLSVLLHSGVPILESLEITADTVNNTVMARAISDVKQGVMSGEAIAKPLANHAIFPPMVVQMMAVGEETGALEEMLRRLADFFDQEIEALVDSLTSLLEPLMIVVMGGAVGSMVIALYMPMFNIINLIQ
jgi:type IV pilus assembly protein PilC